MKKFYFLLLISALSFSFAFPQEQPKVTIEQLGINLYEITLASCNIIASISPEGVLLVDANYKQAGKYLAEEIEKLGGKNINYIINTHWHFDHVGGNQVLANDSTVIIAHKDVKELCSEDRFLMGDTIKALPENALPKITFDKNYELEFNNEKIELIAVSGGHSAGDIVVYFKNANIIHIGDIVFADMFPFVDYDHGGSVYTLEKNIQRIIDMIPDDAKIIPGHGRAYTKEDLKKFREMVLATTELVKKEKDKGKTLEEIKKENVLKDWQDWAKAFTCDDWTEIIYCSR
jgi:cyclase